MSDARVLMDAAATPAPTLKLTRSFGFGGYTYTKATHHVIVRVQRARVTFLEPCGNRVYMNLTELDDASFDQLRAIDAQRKKASHFAEPVCVRYEPCVANVPISSPRGFIFDVTSGKPVDMGAVPVGATACAKEVALSLSSFWSHATQNPSGSCAWKLKGGLLDFTS